MSENLGLGLQGVLKQPEYGEILIKDALEQKKQQAALKQRESMENRANENKIYMQDLQDQKGLNHIYRDWNNQRTNQFYSDVIPLRQKNPLNYTNTPEFQKLHQDYTNDVIDRVNSSKIMDETLNRNALKDYTLPVDQVGLHGSLLKGDYNAFKQANGGSDILNNNYLLKRRDILKETEDQVNRLKPDIITGQGTIDPISGHYRYDPVSQLPKDKIREIAGNQFDNNQEYITKAMPSIALNEKGKPDKEAFIQRALQQYGTPQKLQSVFQSPDEYLNHLREREAMKKESQASKINTTDAPGATFGKEFHGLFKGQADSENEVNFVAGTADVVDKNGQNTHKISNVVQGKITQTADGWLIKDNISQEKEVKEGGDGEKIIEDKYPGGKRLIPKGSWYSQITEPYAKSNHKGHEEQWLEKFQKDYTEIKGQPFREEDVTPEISAKIAMKMKDESPKTPATHFNPAKKYGL